MNFVQQFLDENLGKGLNHQLLQQIQNGNSALETLISNLEAIRQAENQSTVHNRVRRIQNYLDLQKQIVFHLQTVNSSTHMIDWLMNSFLSNRLLYELVHKEQLHMQKQLIQIGKRTLLQPNHQKQHLQDVELGAKITRQLEELNQDRNSSQKKLNRQKIKQIDIHLEQFELKIKHFEQKVNNFNLQILFLVKKVYAFEQKIKNQFNNHLSSNEQSILPLSQQRKQQNQKTFTRNHSVKSHLSLNSQQNEFHVKTQKDKKINQNQLTPRRNLETSKYDGKMFQNRRSSIDYRDVQMRKILQAKERGNMHKTLSSFNFARPQSSNLLYTGTQFGGAARMPTQWGDVNQRSSISYYPRR